MTSIKQKDTPEVTPRALAGGPELARVGEEMKERPAGWAPPLLKLETAGES
jgi:hypothetical protein